MADVVLESRCCSCCIGISPGLCKRDAKQTVPEGENYWHDRRFPTTRMYDTRLLYHFKAPQPHKKTKPALYRRRGRATHPQLLLAKRFTYCGSNSKVTIPHVDGCHYYDLPLNAVRQRTTASNKSRCPAKNYDKVSRTPVTTKYVTRPRLQPFTDRAPIDPSPRIFRVLPTASLWVAWPPRRAEFFLVLPFEELKM